MFCFASCCLSLFIDMLNVMFVDDFHTDTLIWFSSTLQTFQQFLAILFLNISFQLMMSKYSLRCLYVWEMMELFLSRNILTHKHTFGWKLHLHVKEIYLYTLSEYMIQIPHFAYCSLASNVLLVCILVFYGYSCTVMICHIL